MSNNENKSLSDKQSTMSKNEIVTIILPLVIVGLSFFSNWLFNYVNWWAILINSVIVLLGLLVVTFVDHGIKVRGINSELDSITKATIELKEAAKLEDISERLKEVVRKINTSTDLLKYVADGEQLLKIEGSVGDSGVSVPKVYVQSSQFELETSNSRFAVMLLENLRKGVQYRYLIPDYQTNREEYDRFEDMIFGWWKDYSAFVFDEEICYRLLSQGLNASWNEEYKLYLNKACDNWKKKVGKEEWKNLALGLFRLFMDRIVVYTADESRFYIVTAIYQVGINSWKAIVKLPTDYLDDDINDYYSFVVFGEEQESSENLFIKKFRANFNERSRYSMDCISKKITESIERYVNENY